MRSFKILIDLKKILFLVLLLVFGKISFAQKLYQDKIYLKNGEIISGALIDQVLNVSVSIIIQNGDTLNYMMDEVAKLTRENIQSDIEQTNGEQWLKPGYKLTVEIARSFGTGEFGMDYFEIDLINGVRLTSYFSAGFGIGLTYSEKMVYNWIDKTKILVPVFIDLKINYPVHNKISPYFAFDFGVSFHRVENYYYDNTGEYYIDFVGLFLNPSMGASIRFSKKSSLNLAVGYKSHKMPFWDEYFPERNASGIHTDINYSNSINIIAGITF